MFSFEIDLLSYGFSVLPEFVVIAAIDLSAFKECKTLGNLTISIDCCEGSLVNVTRGGFSVLDIFELIFGCTIVEFKPE